MWKTFRERGEPIELDLVADLLPSRVIEALLAPGRVHAGGEDVALLVPTDPDILPRGRDGQRSDIVAERTLDGFSVPVEIDESFASSDPAIST